MTEEYIVFVRNRTRMPTIALARNCIISYNDKNEKCVTVDNERFSCESIRCFNSMSDALTFFNAFQL